MTLSKRRIFYQNMEKILTDAGYSAWPIHLTRIHIAALLFMACSQIGAAKHVKAWRVYRCLQVLLARTLQGAKFCPKHIQTIWEKARLEEDREDVELVGSSCPCCGQALPTNLKEKMLLPFPYNEALETMTPDDLQVKSRNSPHNP